MFIYLVLIYVNDIALTQLNKRFFGNDDDSIVMEYNLVKRKMKRPHYFSSQNITMDIQDTLFSLYRKDTKKMSFEKLYRFFFNVSQFPQNKTFTYIEILIAHIEIVFLWNAFEKAYFPTLVYPTDDFFRNLYTEYSLRRTMLLDILLYPIRHKLVSPDDLPDKNFLFRCFQNETNNLHQYCHELNKKLPVDAIHHIFTFLNSFHQYRFTPSDI